MAQNCDNIRAMSTISPTKMTAEQFLMLGEDPPGIRLELVDGAVAVSPSPAPKHSVVVVALTRILGAYVDDHDLGDIYLDVDTLLDNFNIRRPDLLFYATENLDLVGEKCMEGPPDLAIEVLSPSSVDIDRKVKFAQYRKAGVRFYWIVDPKLKTIEGWELKNRRYVAIGRGQGNAIVKLAPFAELEIPLSRLWRRKTR
jgi:Uma2 family endonuclease